MPTGDQRSCSVARYGYAAAPRYTATWRHSLARRCTQMAGVKGRTRRLADLLWLASCALVTALAPANIVAVSGAMRSARQWSREVL